MQLKISVCDEVFFVVGSRRNMRNPRASNSCKRGVATKGFGLQWKLVFSVEQCVSKPWLQPEVLDCKGGLQSRARLWILRIPGFQLQVWDLDQGPKFVIGGVLARNDILKQSWGSFCFLLLVILQKLALLCWQTQMPGIWDVSFFVWGWFFVPSYSILVFASVNRGREHHYEQWCCPHEININ